MLIFGGQDDKYILQIEGHCQLWKRATFLCMIRAFRNKGKRVLLFGGQEDISIHQTGGPRHLWNVAKFLFFALPLLTADLIARAMISTHCICIILIFRSHASSLAVRSIDRRRSKGGSPPHASPYGTSTSLDLMAF